ncbi:MAG: hypothetical protein LBQ16_06590 [Gracilibacteraceae bacterium]|jgi:ElaB/YqjD/DUF883 family membrane-anchored ribosome-binding protein|nr:hypothetical protein [Gracilibacteraceae bacterium]
MASVAEFAEGAAAVGGIALEVGGFAVDVAKEKIREFAEDPSGKTSEIVAKGKDFAQKNPNLVVCAGAVAGVLILSRLLFKK